MADNTEGYPRIINQNQEKRVRDLESKAIYLTISYLFLQVIIFNSASSFANRCENWWVPFSFSLLISLLYFFTFSNTIPLYLHLRYRYELQLLEEAQTIRQIRMFRFGSAQEHKPEPESIPVKLIKLRFWTRGLILCLALCGAIVAIACFVIPCGGEVDFQVLYKSMNAWGSL